ncbi:MAG TPA: Na+/H+ antiporter [Solirubrobacterales bacterium]
MHDIESILVLVLAAALLVRLADFGKIPAPIVLVVGGLAIAFIPGLPSVELEPDTIFLVFLPPLVYAAGWRSSPLELRTVMRPLALLSVGLVFLTAAVVALVAHATVPGLTWAEAAILGAVIAPTDTVAATSIFRRLGAPERVRLLVEGESMINDGTALVLYRIAVGVATGSAFAFGDAALEFVGVALGGIVAGLAIGVLSDRILRRLSDSDLTIMLSVLTAYGAYIGAEELHVSGILAAVVAGVYAGYRSPHTLDADVRLNAVAFWSVLVFGLEITLFVLLGLQLPEIVDTLEASPTGVSELVGPIVAIAAASIAARLAFVFAIGSEAGETAGQRFAVGWSGMRGAVSLAAALAVPLSVDGRPQIIFLTFALILVTIVGQGLSLPYIVRALGLEEPRRWSDEEAVARMEAAQSALDRLDQMEDDERAGEKQLTRLRDLYRARFRMCQAVLAGEDQETAIREQRLADYGLLRRELIGVEREELLDLRGAGRLRDQTLRQIERDLDLEEARIRS